MFIDELAKPLGFRVDVTHKRDAVFYKRMFKYCMH